MCTKYEVSMSNSVAQGGVQMMTPMLMTVLMLTTTTLMHHGQRIIVQGSLVDKPNEPKTKKKLFHRNLTWLLTKTLKDPTSYSYLIIARMEDNVGRLLAKFSLRKLSTHLIKQFLSGNVTENRREKSETLVTVVRF